MKRVVFLLLVVLMVVTLVACGAPTPPPEEEVTPPPEEEVTPPPEEEVTPPPVVDWEPPVVPWEPPVEEEPTAPGALPPITFEVISADLGGIRLIGDDLAPYGPDLVSPQNSPWTITIPKGSTITVTIGVSGHPESGDHHIIIEGTDVDVELGVGGTSPPMELTFNEVGTFKVYSENLPEELHGTIVVVEEEVAPEVAALPPIKFEAITADLGGIRLIGDDLAPYGIDLPSPVEAPWTITIPKGSTITVTIGVSGHPESGDHHIIIEGTDVDVELGVGETSPPMELTFNEVGTFKVYSENFPEELECTIVVVEE